MTDDETIDKQMIRIGHSYESLVTSCRTILNLYQCREADMVARAIIARVVKWIDEAQRQDEGTGSQDGES